MQNIEKDHLNNRVVILFQEVFETSNEDEKDVLVQVEYVAKALLELGYEVNKVSVSLEINNIIKQLNELSPAFIFNLVETVNSFGSLAHWIPSLLDTLKIKYTGCKTESMFLLNDKVLTKKIMKMNRIPTPNWFYRESDPFLPEELYLIKPVSEEASIGINQDSIMRFSNKTDLIEELNRRKKILGVDMFAEEYIDGREFNVSILGTNGRANVLPIPEMLFKGYDKLNKYKIVDYKAKWDEDSYELINTVRTFACSKNDAQLLSKLNKIANESWEIFSLSGYCRLDIRVDKNNNPFVLEINTNPCISPDSGFIAATVEAGFSFNELVKQIINEIEY
jgi:D-alanine-D-alanine ligase